MTVAACLICKDGVDVVGNAIATVRPFVDEICVYDTGSTDGTLELLAAHANRPGAPILVEEGEWCDDYALARQRSFRMASSDWLLWMDDDDTIEGAANLRRLDELPDDVDHVYLRRVSGSVVTAPWAVWITRPGACVWKGRVHEMLYPERELACAAALTGKLWVSHPLSDQGKHDDEVLAAVDLPSEVETNGGLVFFAAYAAMRRGDTTEAIDLLRGFLETAPQEDKAWRMLTQLVYNRDGPGAALAVMEECIAAVDRVLAARAAGEVSLAGFFDRLHSWRPPAGKPNARCKCGSGLKLKHCCRNVVFLRPDPSIDTAYAESKLAKFRREVAAGEAYAEKVTGVARPSPLASPVAVLSGRV